MNVTATEINKLFESRQNCLLLNISGQFNCDPNFQLSVIDRLFPRFAIWRKRRNNVTLPDHTLVTIMGVAPQNEFDTQGAIHIFTVGDREVSLLVAKFLCDKLSGYSRNKIDKWIQQDAVTVNGLIVKGSYKVKVNDVVRVKTGESQQMETENDVVDLGVVDMEIDMMDMMPPKYHKRQVFLVKSNALSNYSVSLLKTTADDKETGKSNINEINKMLQAFSSIILLVFPTDGKKSFIDSLDNISHSYSVALIKGVTRQGSTDIDKSEETYKEILDEYNCSIKEVVDEKFTQLDFVYLNAAVNTHRREDSMNKVRNIAKTISSYFSDGLWILLLEKQFIKLKTKYIPRDNHYTRDIIFEHCVNKTFEELLNAEEKKLFDIIVPDWKRIVDHYLEGINKKHANIEMIIKNELGKDFTNYVIKHIKTLL